MPEVSIVIRTYNEEKHLPALLDSLAHQTYRDFETVVVDSGSFDMTREIARQRADRLIRIEQRDFTFGYSVNEGISNSKGRFVVIISAHALPTDTSWLVNLVAPLSKSRTAMVYGRQVGPSDSKFSEIIDFERTFGLEGKTLSPPNFFANNANSAIRRDSWEERPFDDSLPGLEDIEWAKHWMERGFEVIYEPLACIYHFHSESWPQLRRRYYREGQAAKWIGISHRRDLAKLVWRETCCFLGDLSRALRRRCLLEKGSEIARFRFEKLVGTGQGIWDGAQMNNPLFREKLFFEKHYKALVIERPGRASIEDVELLPLKPSEVLVRVAYEGVCTTDLEIFDGTLGYYKKGVAKYPIVPGHEFSGTIAAVGARVTDLNEGDRVVVECIQGCGECTKCKKGNWIGCVRRQEVGVIGRDGGYAEYMTTPARFVHQLPESLSLKEACLCEPTAVVIKGLRRLERVCDRVIKQHMCAVIGAGPIGHLAARILDLRGHKVTVFDNNPNRLACFAKSDIGKSQDLHVLKDFDAIVEATGEPNALETVLANSEPGSTILLLGLPYREINFNFESIVGYDKIIVGSVGSGREEFQEAMTVLPQISTSVFIEKVLPFAEFPQAWEMARARACLKVILRIDPSLKSRGIE